MSEITIKLPDDCFRKLSERAAQLNVAPEDLVLASIEELVAQPDTAFRQATEYLLDKNEELYRRLA